MSLCFSEQDDFEYTVKTFIRNGVLQQIVHMLHDSNEECRSLATRLLTRFLGRRVALTTTFTLAGAVRPLILMLDRPRLLKEATFALNHLSISVQAEAVNYQILLEGGLAALMTAFRLPDVQRDRELVLVLAALLFRVATYRDGFVFFVKMGGLRMLRTTEMHEEDVRDMASTYLGHMEILMMGEADEYNAKSLVLAAREADAGDELGSLCVHGLAVLANPTKFGAIFVYHNLLEILLDLYGRFFNEAQQQEGAEALYSIACRSREFLQRHVLANNLDVREIVDEALNYQSHTAQPDPHPTTEVGGLDFDVTFLLDNNTKPILAHKRVLRKVSRVFEVLLEDDYFQSTGGVIPVHNIGFSAFKSVMQFIYTGRLREDTTLHEYCDIFIAADFYDVISLKRVCELFIARHHVAQETVADVYEFGERYDSKLLIHVCILFLLEHHQQVRSLSGYRTLVEKIIPEMRRWFPTFIPGPQHGFIAPLSGL